MNKSICKVFMKSGLLLRCDHHTLFGIHVVHLENENFIIQFFSNIGIQSHTTASPVYSAFEYTWI